jgi:predicted transcriptional regulator
MELREIVDLIACDVLAGHDHLDMHIEYAFGSDLMSDVLAYVESDALLITGLVNHQVIRTAEMLDLKAVVFIRGKRPSEEVIKLANAHGMTLLATKHTMYTAAGILYANGLKGISV